MNEIAFLDLGKLDGRLKYSPVADIWGVRMRLRAISQSAVNAGIPVDSKEVEEWISGSALPPRYKQGLNDPIHITTVAHFVCEALALSDCGLHLKSSLIWDPVFRAREELFHWAIEEYEVYTAIWRSVRDYCLKLPVPKSPEDIVDVVQAIMMQIKSYDHTGIQRISVQSHSNERLIPAAWLTGLFVPYLIQKFFLTDTLMPNKVLPLQFLDRTPSEITASLNSMLAREAEYGLRELDRLERSFEHSSSGKAYTKRSRYQAAAKYLLAFPMISRRRLSGAIGTTPQGTGYLVRRIKERQSEGVLNYLRS